jgi:hypothetical protein
VTCDSSIGSDQSSASSAYYPGFTRGATTGLCVADSDYPVMPAGVIGSVGFWQYEVADHGPKATYMDPDNPLGLDGFVYSFIESDCNSSLLGDNAMWTEVKLSDVF